MRKGAVRVGAAAVSNIRSRIDIADHVGAELGPVRDPQLVAVRAVKGLEQRLTVAKRGDAVRIGAAGAGIDVGDHVGPAGGAIGDPQLVAVCAVSGLE